MMKQLIKTIVAPILHSVQDFFFIVSKCWLSIIMLLAGAYAFLLNDQGQDIVTAYNESKSWGMSIITALCILFWGIESWFGARMAFNLSDFSDINYTKKNQLPVWLPRVFGFLSMAVFYISYLLFNETLWAGDIIILFVPFALYWFLIVKRRKLVKKFNKSNKLNLQFKINKIKNEAIAYSKVSKWGKRFFIMPIVLFFMLVIVIGISPVSFASASSPAVIILLGLAVWTGLATAFTVIEKTLKIPLVLIAVVIIFVFSFINNNHTVRTTNPVTKIETIASSLNQWTGRLQADSLKPKVLFIACGEGGGIRAAYWTASVLASITDTAPTFPKHLFALSTVSGSSLGASVYNSILKYNKPNESISKQVRDFMKEDYLSPIAAAFLFPDALQRILPFPVGHFDRARYLEWSWEKGWANNFTSPTNPFAENMHNLWSDSTLLPNMFLNSTHTESGRRSVVSNLMWVEAEWLSDNVNKLTGKEMPLSSSTLLSARFPVLTPGAKIIDTTKNYWGTLVDGGYYDNYGAITAFDLYNDIRKIYKPSELKIVVLMILNGDSVPKDPNPLKFAYEMLTVPSTFLNTWTVSPEKSLNMLNDILTANNDTVISIKLNRYKSENLPLGWYLSDKAMNIMDNQLNSSKWLEQKKQIVELMQP